MVRPRKHIDPAVFRLLWARPHLQVPAIAKALGVSTRKAQDFAAELMLPPRPPGPAPAPTTQEQDALFAQLYASSLPVADIGMIFGISQTQVSRIAYRRQLPPRRPRAGKGAS